MEKITRGQNLKLLYQTIIVMKKDSCWSILMTPEEYKNSAEREGPIYGSDLIVDILKEYGLEYVASNIG